MDHAGVQGPSRRRVLRESSVQQHLDELRDFAAAWRRFASESSRSWERFRNEGALLPTTFFAELQVLQGNRSALLQLLKDATLMAFEGEWQFPGDDASLNQVEESLVQLIRLCREAERRFRVSLQSAMEFLGCVRGLRTDAMELQQQLSELQGEAEQDLGFIEQLCMEDEQQLELAMQPWRSLFLLVLDGGRNRGTQLEFIGLPMLGVADSERHFQLAEKRLGSSLPLQAVRGQFQVGADSVDEVLRYLYPEIQQERQRPTAAQLDALRSRFGDSQSAAPRSTTVGQFPAAAVSAASAAAATAATGARGSRAGSAELQALREQLESQRLSGGEAVAAADELLVLCGEAMKYVADVLQLRGEQSSEHADELKESFQLLAEAQCMLRVWHERAPQSSDNSVVRLQGSIFQWLKSAVSIDAEGILIERFMRRVDVAEPAGAGQLLRRVQAASQQLQQQQNRRRQLANLKQAVGELPRDHTQSAWSRVDRFLQHFERAGGSTQDAELRALLLPHVDLFPEVDGDSENGGGTCSPLLLAVLQELQQEVDERSLEELESEAGESRAATPEVLEVRELLKGQRIALVGGVPRSGPQERIRQAFGLAHLEWIPASKRDRVSDLEPLLKDVNLVVLITRIIGHKHNDLRDACSARNIPWVQTRKNCGYGVNQLAHAILQQRSRQLSGAE